MRVREMLERSRRSLLDSSARQRWEGPTRQLLERSRATVAQIVGTPPEKESEAQDVLAGVCSSVALRDLNLVDSLLEQLEQMEAHEDDPEVLAQLYKLDHLATRLRRNSENLRVLAGREAGRGKDETAFLVDVIRAGMSSIESYSRVELGKIAALGVVGLAADDVGRIVAELLDNATTHSPPSSQVIVSAHLTEQASVMLRVEDTGIGMPPARITMLNESLSSQPVLDRNAVRHMGLAVVRRLASRHGIRVWLSQRAPHGTIASVLLPVSLIHEPRDGHGSQRPAVSEASAGSPGAPIRMRVEKQKQASGATDSALPKRDSAVRQEESAAVSKSGSPAQTPGPAQDAPSTTPGGLPRRVPKSLADTSVRWPLAEPMEPDEATQREGHERLLEDLGAFAEGQQAAQTERAQDDRAKDDRAQDDDSNDNTG